MPMQRYKPEQIVTVLRQIEVAVANGKSTSLVCKEAGIHTQTYYRWQKEYGGLKVEQAKRMKALEKENTRLKRLAAALCGGACTGAVWNIGTACLPAAGAMARDTTVRADGSARRG